MDGAKWYSGKKQVELYNKPTERWTTEWTDLISGCYSKFLSLYSDLDFHLHN